MFPYSLRHVNLVILLIYAFPNSNGLLNEADGGYFSIKGESAKVQLHVKTHKISMTYKSLTFHSTLLLPLMAEKYCTEAQVKIFNVDI